MPIDLSSSTIGLLARQVRDTQSVVSRVDRHLSRLIDAPVQRGEQLVALTASRLARMIGNETVADRLEAKALASPAQTTVATWAAELSSAGCLVLFYRLNGARPWPASSPVRRRFLC